MVEGNPRHQLMYVSQREANVAVRTAEFILQESRKFQLKTKTQNQPREIQHYPIAHSTLGIEQCMPRVDANGLIIDPRKPQIQK